MEFDKAMLLPFLDKNPGNVSTYLRLRKYTKAKDWTNNDWERIYILYNSPSPAWLWDIYKNKNLFDIKKTYNDILYLKNYIR